MSSLPDLPELPERDSDRDDRIEDLRSEARERALALLYEANAKGLSGTEVIAGLPVPPDKLAVLLVVGVETHREEIDQLISGFAKGWSLERMPVIDRSVLRLATFELLQRPEVPVAVVLDEAVELAKHFSTDDSGRFVNGVLAAIAKQVR
ncbi:MAG: nusB [Acidimicrobiia bacterium]|nr:nusB [Acidimicrobiia bacterium]